MENNNQNIKLCPTCGSKNKSIYKYCNECGAPLNQSYYSGVGSSQTNGTAFEQNQNSSTNQNPQYNADQTYYNGQFNQGGYTPYAPYGNSMNEPYYGTPDFNGISAKDVYEFTGKKADLFYKLKLQHFSGKSGPYCWPLFFLGLFLGFFGIGCWYLYHKMYKPAVGFFSVAVTNAIINLYFIFFVFNNLTIEQIREIVKLPEVAYDYIVYSSGPLAFLSTISSIIEFAALVLTIVLPFFAYNWYKNHALNRICEEYAKSPMPNIIAAGGSKGGLVAIISVSYAIIFVVAVALSTIPFIKKVVKIALEDVDGGKTNYHYEIPYNDRNYGGQMPFDEGMPFGDEFPFDDEFPFGNEIPYDFGYGEEIPFTENEPKGEYW